MKTRFPAALLLFLAYGSLFAAPVTFEAAITASGEETVGYESREFWGEFPYFEVQGGTFGGTPARTETVSFCLPPDVANECAIDTSRTHSTQTAWSGGYGQGGPGYGIYVDQINSPGGAEGATYNLNGDCLTSTVTVRAKRLQRGWYAGRHVIYARCPITRPWSHTETKGPFTLDSDDGYSFITRYTGPIGSPDAESAFVYPNDNGYKVEILDKNPADAVMTAGMFRGTSFSNGPDLYALYDANDIEALGLEVTQGVQNIYNDMPLMAGRRTLARFYVRARHRTGNVNARLRAFRYGTELDGSPLEPESTIAVRPSGISRVELDHAFLFRLPDSWAALGEVQFRATVNPGNLAEEAQPANNTSTAEIRFHVSSDTVNTVVPLALHLHEDGDRDKPLRIYDRNDVNFNSILNYIVRWHPAAAVRDTGCIFKPMKPLFHDGVLRSEWDITDDNHWDRIVNQVAWKRFWSSCGWASSFWAGMVDPYFIDTPKLGSAITPGHSSATKMSDLRVHGWGSGPWLIRGGQTFAHEIGHNKGLRHVCEPEDEDGDTGYPYPDTCDMSLGEPAFFDEGHDGYAMMDVYHDYWGGAEPAVVGLSGTTSDFAEPMMSWNNVRWISPYSYCKLLDRDGVPCNASLIASRYNKDKDLQFAEANPESSAGRDKPAVTTGAVAADMPPGSDTVIVNPGELPPAVVLPDNYQVPDIDDQADAYLVVQGLFDLTTDRADGVDVMRTPHAPGDNAFARARKLQEELAALSAYELHNLRGVLVLNQYDNAASRTRLRTDIISRLNTTPGEGGSGRFFLQLVEWAEGAGYVEINYGDEVVAAVAASNAPPRVEFEPFPAAALTAGAVLQWTASDPDGDPLTYSLFYSADGGATWDLVESGLESTEYAVDDGVPAGKDPLSYFKGTDAGLFRVMAFDGFHTAAGDLKTPLAVPGSPPRVHILQRDGYRVDAGKTVYLTGQVNDTEDGPIPSVEAQVAAMTSGEPLETAALRWTSSLDGLLGHGPEIVTRELSTGVHRITLTATDSDGETSSASIRLYVGVDRGTRRNVAPEALASASSTYCMGSGAHCYHPGRINDNDRSTALGGYSSWANTGGVPQWVQLAWDDPVVIDHVEVFSTQGYVVRDYDLQYWDGAGWRTVAAVRGNTQVRRLHRFDAVETGRLRVLGLSGPAHQTRHVRVNELVVDGAYASPPAPF